MRRECSRCGAARTPKGRPTGGPSWRGSSVSPSVLVMLMQQPVQQVLQDVTVIPLRPLAVLVLERRVMGAVQRVQVEPEVGVPHTAEGAHGPERADAQNDRQARPAPTAGTASADPPADGALDV